MTVDNSIYSGQETALLITKLEYKQLTIRTTEENRALMPTQQV